MALNLFICAAYKNYFLQVKATQRILQESERTNVEEHIMMKVSEGQCGLCSHFGEHHESAKLVEIRTTHQASEDLVTECGHPKLESLHLRVTPVSGCDGYQAAA
jgi:hypothetical protein